MFVGTLPEAKPRNGCGGMLTGVGGVIESPGYPNKYKNFTDCEWLIRVHYTKRIFVKILELQLEGGSGERKLVLEGFANTRKPDVTFMKKPLTLYILQFNLVLDT